jgi:DNA/RNA-binding domain of Phe-tRNA-synthetase-like protein
MELKHIQISGSLDDIARVGVVFLKQVANTGASAPLRERMDSLALELRSSIGGRNVSELEGVRRTRRLYHLLGIDPTKERPSSEKLLRRILQGEALPRVNKLTDLTNLTSLSLQCPLSVYDWDKITPPVLLRIGRPEDGAAAGSIAASGLEGKLVAVDGEGLLGTPSFDGDRARTSSGTVRALVLAWGSAEAPRSFLESVLQEIIALARELCEARVAEWGTLG